MKKPHLTSSKSLDSTSKLTPPSPLRKAKSSITPSKLSSSYSPLLVPTEIAFSHEGISGNDIGIELGAGLDISPESSSDLNASTSELSTRTIPDSDQKIPAETAFEKFSRYCGITKTGRSYGKFETSGIVANLKFNRFLKRSGVESTGPNKRASDATSFTREAFYVEVDDKASGIQRDRDVINALPDGSKTTFRVKDIKYGNHNAMWEILSGQLYGLTGLTAPDTRYLVHEDYGNRPDGSPKVFVASPTITGYSDLGDFLIDESIRRFIKAEDLEKWLQAKEEIEKINKKSKDGLVVTAADKMERLEHMDKIYQIMPDYFHAEIEKSFAASKFIANWDFANLNLNNIGCRFTLNRQGEVIGFESVFVDFGNSGAIGFKGKYKELSLDHANSEAKNHLESPKDYDPALTFDNEDLKFILQRAKQIKDEEEKLSSTSSATSISEPESDSEWSWEQDIQNSLGKAVSQIQSWIWPQNDSKDAPSNTEKLKELAALQQQLKEISPETINQALNSISSDCADHPESLTPSQRNIARSIMFKTAHHIRPEEADIGLSKSTTGFLTVSDLPRNLPFGFLFKSSQRQKTNAASSLDVSKPLEFRNDFYRDSEVEMAFRLSLIPDEAIDHMVNKWYLCEEFPTIFPIPEQFRDNPDYTAKGVASIYKERRDSLVNSIPPVIIDEWTIKNPTQALAAQQEVELALLKKMRDPSLTFNRAPGSVDQFAQEVSINPHNSFSARSALADRTSEIYPTEIFKAEIARYNEEIKIEGLEHIKELRNELDLTPKERRTTAEVLKEKIVIMESEVAQKKQESILDFLSLNIEKWKNALGLRSHPNCSLFNLGQIREIYQIRNNINPTPMDRILNQEECFDRNQTIHGENEFTCRRVMEIFDALSLSRQKLKDPASMFSSASSSKLSKLVSQQNLL